MKKNLLFLLFLFFLSCSKIKEAPLKSSGVTTTNFNTLSEQFIALARDGKDTQDIQKQLANTTVNKLSKALVTDEQKLAFWINIYNAYIQVILQEKPESYKDRDSFFSKKQIKIAGETIAFSKIEHGIIRKSQWNLGFGYIKTWFPNKFERKLRVKNRDYRIHFALNCGAKDCPPVAIYKPKRIKEQLEYGTTLFLKQSSKYNSKTNEVFITSLFSWFKGDFGGKDGIKKLLYKQKIIPDTKGVNLQFTDYDWTLDLNNYIDL